MTNKYWTEFKAYAEATNAKRKAEWERKLDKRVIELKKTKRLRCHLVPLYAELTALGDVKMYDEIEITIESYMDYCTEKGYKI